MAGDEPQGSIAQLTGMMGFIHRSGALAPFQVIMIITGIIFALAAFQRENAYGQPLCFWVLCLLTIEVIITLITGLILACCHPDCLLSEKFQQTMKEMDATQKGLARSHESVDSGDSSDESDDGSGGGENMNERLYLLVLGATLNLEEARKYIDAQNCITDWFCSMPNSIFLVSRSSATDIYNLMRSRFSEGRMFITEVSTTNRQGWLPRDHWNRINNIRI